MYNKIIWYSVLGVSVGLSNVYASDSYITSDSLNIDKIQIPNPDWSFNDDFEESKNTQFWTGFDNNVEYGAEDPTNPGNKVLKFKYLENRDDKPGSGYSFELPINATKISLSWKQYIPKNYLRNNQKFFTLWSGPAGTKQSNITLSSSLWSVNYFPGSNLGVIPSINVGIDGVNYGHNMNSNHEFMFENSEGRWVDMQVYIELAKNASDYGRMDIYKNGELITSTHSDSLTKAYSDVPGGAELIQYSSRGNYINKGKLFGGWMNTGFETQTEFLIDDFEIAASSNPSRSDFVDFNGAPEDQALIDELMSKYFVINEPKRIIYVAPMTDDNSESGTGNSQDDPKRNLKSVLINAQPGDHFYLAPGVYHMDQENPQLPKISLSNINGTLKDKIVVTTDPNLFDPENDKIAQIDFNFKNKSDRAIGLYVSHWVIENLEIRNMNGIGIAISGRYNLIRNNNIHHGKLISGNNLALVMSKTRMGGSYNLIMKNHLHHFGHLDEDNKELIAPSDVGRYDRYSNGGCFYSEEVQYYKVEDKVLAAGYAYVDESNTGHLYDKWRDLSWDEIKSKFMLPASSHVYLYNNAVDNCYPYGLASKNSADGPYYFLSNIIHSAPTGLKATLSGTVVRNNIIYKDKWMETGIDYGSQYNPRSILGNLVAGVGMKVTNNTIVGPKKGIEYKMGWDGYVANNVILDVEIPHYLSRVYHSWLTNRVGKTDNQGNPKYTKMFTGEYLYGDVNPDNDMYKDMPLSLQQLEYSKLKIENDIYTVEPILKWLIWDDQANYLNLKKVTEDYTIYPSEAIKSYMVAPESYDFRKNKENSGILEGVGSNIQ
ncbi:right-handed parallel beta-helix repeat-containing protein [Vibrio mangrovi]|uniref:Right handed beta helix domain-containing protein n=1 Tax=Vibrio mangrovi TaxID=474394 RepID=A0A1Y6IXC2_9VIBR|nr:right-handed parallel beta-helix repeat-containing protein [Vibrio mangrovi]MDW6004851.1 hypothetical protein [Vibrio mangrovi]SMS01142.1 hypothetical protein VIM7927_02419 [Vibrio mangrovi]